VWCPHQGILAGCHLSGLMVAQPASLSRVTVLELPSKWFPVQLHDAVATTYIIVQESSIPIYDWLYAEKINNENKHGYIL